MSIWGESFWGKKAPESSILVGDASEIRVERDEHGGRKCVRVHLDSEVTKSPRELAKNIIAVVNQPNVSERDIEDELASYLEHMNKEFYDEGRTDGEIYGYEMGKEEGLDEGYDMGVSEQLENEKHRVIPED